MEIGAGRHTIWDFWARRYERLWAQRFSLGPTRRTVLEFLECSLSPGASVLDIGCGVGQLAFELSSKRADVNILAIDTCQTMITRAVEDYGAPNISYKNISVDEIPADLRFDVITSTHSFPYLPDKARAAQRIYELLKPNGRAAIVQANNNNLYDSLWLFFVKFTTSQAEYHSVSRLKRLLSDAGFKIGTVDRIRTPFFIPSIYLVEGIKLGP